VRCLLDTHTLIWWMIGDSHLSKAAHDVIENVENVSLVSVVFAWEMATKVRLGRLPVAADMIQDLVASVLRERMEILAVTADHGIRAGLLPGPHKDPFDRMLIAQAQAENLSIVSNDRALDGYGARRLW
jgi:PIN domain nuclease of toxin-antitoxin system